MSKETYTYGKRDLFIWQKRSIHTGIPEDGPNVDEVGVVCVDVGQLEGDEALHHLFGVLCVFFGCHGHYQKHQNTIKNTKKKNRL